MAVRWTTKLPMKRESSVATLAMTSEPVTMTKPSMSRVLARRMTVASAAYRSAAARNGSARPRRRRIVG